MADYLVTTASAAKGFYVPSSYNSFSCPTTVAIDSAHVLVTFSGQFVTGSTVHGLSMVLNIDTSTWVVTTNTALTYSTNTWGGNATIAIDTNHVLLAYRASASFHARVLEVNTTTWAVTTAGDDFDTGVEGLNYNAVQLDATHFLFLHSHTYSSGLFANILAVDTSTWAVSTATSEFTINNISIPASYPMTGSWSVDTNHFIIFFASPPVAYTAGFQTQIIEVNTSTWAISTSAAPLSIQTAATNYYESNDCAQIDSTHYLSVFKGNNHTSYAQVITVNTSTWAVTTAAAALNFDTGTSVGHIQVNELATGYYSVVFATTKPSQNHKEYATVLKVNTSTWAVTTTAEMLTGDRSWGGTTNQSSILLDSNHVLETYSFNDGASRAHGYAQVFYFLESASTTTSTSSTTSTTSSTSSTTTSSSTTITAPPTSTSTSSTTSSSTTTTTTSSSTTTTTTSSSTTSTTSSSTSSSTTVTEADPVNTEFMKYGGSMPRTV